MGSIRGRRGEPEPLVKAVTLHRLRLPGRRERHPWGRVVRVPARVFADDELLDAIRADRSLEQLENVATLPGIVEAAIAMPDIHQGYGFPVGGVAATELPDGVVSPGGVGYDINCGVRLLAAPFTEAELGDRRERLVHEISRACRPARARRTAARCAPELDAVLLRGPARARRAGLGTPTTSSTPSRGAPRGADPARVSERARERGRAARDDRARATTSSRCSASSASRRGAAARVRARAGQITVLIHSGSRGLGHQVCTDYVA